MRSAPQTIQERLQNVRSELSRSEQRIVMRLLEDYPLAGFGSLASLAERCEVSPPTVLCLLDKIGFSGYPAFREQVHAELAGLLSSVPSRSSERSASERPSDIENAESRLCSTISATFRSIPPKAIASVSSLLADCNRQVFISGGTFSYLVAAHLAMYLSILRADVIELPPEPRPRLMALFGLRKGDVVVLFDYFFPDAQTTAFGKEVVERGARLVLVTDSPAPPLSEDADQVLFVNARGVVPFPSFVGGFSLVEALTAATTLRLGSKAHARIRKLVDISDEQFSHWGMNSAAANTP